MKSADPVIHNPIPDSLKNTILPEHQLQIRTLGVLEIWLDGGRLHFPFARCGELIVWLALNGAATRSKIIDALWDGSRNPSHLEYFRVVVRRTRATLSKSGNLNFNPLLFENNLYRLAPELTIQTDALKLKAALQTTTLEQLQNALESYHGEFMTHIYREWVNAWKTNTLDAALAIALYLGERLEMTDPQAARDAYQRAVELEPYNQMAHQGLIRVSEKLGEHGAVMVARKVYERIFQQELNRYQIDPSITRSA